MHIASVHLVGFKRFTDTTIHSVPASAKLVVLAGPNGSGKSSLFDGFRTWHSTNGGVSSAWDETYGTKVGSPAISWPNHVIVNFHEQVPSGPDERKKLFYIRSAFRNEADFQINNFARMNSPLDTLKVQRMVDNDMSVSDNYQRLIMQTIEGIYDPAIPDTTPKSVIRDQILGEVQRAMQRVFPDLVLTGVGAMGSGSDGSGTFFFEKGNASKFMYKNLSAGEKAAFDLILDAVVKRKYFDDSIWCIDEPETHLNTRIQATLLETLVDLLPAESQLWIASHSIGFMRRAWEMAQSNPDQVIFLDMQGVDFDSPISIVPIQPSRAFWARTLDVALGDLASLVAPEQLVLCEGKPQNTQQDRKAAFDAACYQRIFSTEFPNTDFLSVGNSHDVTQDRLEIGSAIMALASGTRLIKLIDRDLRSDEEVAIMKSSGARVLSRRHIESFLLDDEAIRKLCEVNGQTSQVDRALEIKAEELAASIARGNDADDMKSAASTIFTELRRLLSLTSPGSDWNAFARDKLAPLLQPGMSVYDQLRQDLFGT